jgi:hypothetical protein
VADENQPPGFVSLKSITAGKPDPAAALAEIRRIYFRTTKRTIDNDLTHAIDLVKSLPDEETRSKAHVYMEGLAEMAREWGKTGRGSGTTGKVHRRKRGPGSA